MNDLDLGLNVLIKIAKENGVSLEQLNKEIDPETENVNWLMNYRNSLQKLVAADIQNLVYAFELLDAAVEREDKVAICVGLSTACTNAVIISNTFQAIYSDCLKMLKQDSRFSWPKIPDDYKIPADYNYKGPV